MSAKCFERGEVKQTYGTDSEQKTTECKED